MRPLLSKPKLRKKAPQRLLRRNKLCCREFSAGAMFLRLASWELTRKILMSVKPARLPRQSLVIHQPRTLFLQFCRSKNGVTTSDDSPIKRASKKRTIRIDSDEESNDTEKKYFYCLLFIFIYLFQLKNNNFGIS